MNARYRRKSVTFQPPIAIRLYLDEVSYRGSPLTLRNCRLDLERRFLPYLEAAGVTDLTEISRPHCAGFVSHEATRGVGRHSVRKSFDIMRRFLAWCVEAGYLEFSPAEGMKPPKLGRSLRQGYTREEVTHLLAHARNGHGFIGPRDYAIVVLLLGTGLRAEGLLSLTVSQFQSSEYRSHRRLRVTEKGDMERLVPVGRKAHMAVMEYLAVRPNVPGDALWISLRRAPLAYSALAKMLENLGEYAGVPNVMAHRFRHTFASEHYRANRDMMALKGALGHHQIATTEQYLRSLGVDFGLAAKHTSPDEWLA